MSADADKDGSMNKNENVVTDKASELKANTEIASEPTDALHSPLLRNAVHAGLFFVFAIPLGLLANPATGPANGRYWVAGFLAAVTLFNFLILRKLGSGKRLARPDEGVVNGLWLYPLSVGICFLVYPAYAAVGAWAVMAAGDAAASFSGRAVPIPKLPWNAKKSWAGLFGFVLAAVPTCYLGLYFVPCPLFLRESGWPELPYVWTLSVIAAVCGAIVESLPAWLDDNVRVPIVSGAALWIFATFLSWSTRGLPKETHVQPEQLLRALACNAALGFVALVFKFADLPGVLLGGALGTIVYFFAQWQGYLLFMLFVIGGSLLSKIGLKYKQRIGAAEAREGQRGASNVAANLLVPGLCCLAYPMSGGRGALLMAFAGALSAAFADTASSEIGAFSRAQPVLITTFKPVPHGTNGAVSLLGSLGALGATCLCAALAWQIDFFALPLGVQNPTPPRVRIAASIALIAAGLLGTSVDSLLGATVEDRSPLIGKGAVNFACTLTGAVVAGLLWAVLF